MPSFHERTAMERIKDKKLFLFDMDGTLYRGENVFDFTAELLRTIRAVGGRYCFLTNNSSKSVADYIEKLARFGIPSEREDFMTSLQATAWYLKQNYPGARLYVCGTKSMKEELEYWGFTITQNVAETDAIVTGTDFELDFKKLSDISQLLCTRDIPYFATNPDLTCPTEFGRVPDCGSISQMLFNVSKKMPMVIGKPSPLMPRIVMEKWGYTPEQSVFIGDWIGTDIKSGLNAGMLTVLVMCGETTRELLDASPDKPHIVAKDCGEMLQMLKTI